MPKPTDNFWDAFQKSDTHQFVMDSITANPEWINELDDLSHSTPFQIAVRGGKHSQTLVNFIMAQKDFNLMREDTKMKESNVMTILLSGNLDVLQALIADSRVLFVSEQKLSYEVVKEQYNSTKTTLATKDPASVIGKRLQAKVANLEAMMDLLRDATVLHAFATDNAELMTKLENAGAKPTTSLGVYGKNEIPKFLVTDQHVNIKAWYKQKATNPNAFFAVMKDRVETVEKIEAQLQENKQDYLKKQVTASKGYTDNTAEITKQAEELSRGIKVK